MSRYITLPFPGAWVDQPTWIQQDFKTLLSVGRWYDFNEQLKPVAGLPNAENVP